MKYEITSEWLSHKCAQLTSLFDADTGEILHQEYSDNREREYSDNRERGMSLKWMVEDYEANGGRTE